MKQYTFIILFWSSFAVSQVLAKPAEESAEQFASRVKPRNSEISHKVIETKWDSSSVILGFYDQTYKLPEDKDPDQQDYHRIIAKLYLQRGAFEFQVIDIDIFDSEGGVPVVETVLFANADKDEAKEMIIIISWEQRHYDVSGKLYSTFVYDDFQKKELLQLTFLESISKKLDGGCDCTWRDGKSKTAKYKTAEDIKNGLRKSGFQ